MTRLWIYRSGPPVGWQAAAGAWAAQRQHCFHLLSRSAHICMLILLYPHLRENTLVAAAAHSGWGINRAGSTKTGTWCWWDVKHRENGDLKKCEIRKKKNQRGKKQNLHTGFLIFHVRMLSPLRPVHPAGSVLANTCKICRGQSRSGIRFRVSRWVTFSGRQSAPPRRRSADVAAGKKSSRAD